MKLYKLTINEEEKKWLELYGNKMLTTAKRDPGRFSDFGATLHSLLEKVSEAEEVKEPKAQRGTKKEEEYLPNLCSDHPSYNASKPPRIDCKGHWDAYRRMHPENYQKARRDFERRLKKTKEND